MADDDRIDLTEVAKILGYTYGTARTMRSTGQFPEPAGFLGRTPWWYRSKVLEWKETRSERAS